MFDSKLEKKFAKILTEAKIKWISQYPIFTKRYDFYLPDYKILVEIDGDFFHTNTKAGFKFDKKFKKRIARNDALKNLIAKKQGFKLIRIWETDLKTLNESKLKELLK